MDAMKNYISHLKSALIRFVDCRPPQDTRLICRIFSVQGMVVIILLVLIAVCFAVIYSDDVEMYVGELLGFPETEKISQYETTEIYRPKNDILTFLGLTIGGVLLVLQAVIANRRTKAMEKGNDNVEQGQRQERLKNAIEHLGDESASVRLGGIYELFHLAEDTDYMRETVLDILCAHIRRTTSEYVYRGKYSSNPSEEIQSLLTLLFVRKYETFKNQRANLVGCWLNGANLNGAWLQSAHLEEAYLRHAHLEEANLQHAHLEEAQVQRAHLEGAYLQHAHLGEAQLQHVHLEGAYLQHVHLEDAKLQGAYLIDAKLQDAHLDRAQLQGARLQKARLQRAYLIKARLQGAKLFHARLQGAYLYSAMLQDAALSEAKLQEARLDNAQLQGAILIRAKLQGATLFKAGLQGTVLFDVKLQGANLSEAELQGATLTLAQLQGAELHRTILQGVNSPNIHIDMFKEHITKRAGENNNLSGVIFAGGLSEDDVASLVIDMTADAASKLRKRLKPHITPVVRRTTPDDSGAITKPPYYTQADAAQWIADYEAAMSEVPKEDNN